jgi:prolipoprotein diacylglyceryltransferase
MYPDLSYLFHDLFGTSVDNWVSIFKTFGFLLVIALMACGVFLKYELQQKEKAGLILPQKVTISSSDQIAWSDILTNALFLLIFGAKLPLLIMNFNDFKGDPASFIFSKLGIWWIGFILAIGSILYHIWKNKNSDSTIKSSETTLFPSEKTNDIIIIAGISGVLGSKLFSITEDMAGFFKDPLGALFSGSGLNIYGGLILASIAVIWYTRKIGIKTTYMMDIGGMGILLGYALGRIGCQLSGDGDWGIEASLPPNWWFLPEWLWSYNYPTNVNNDGVLMSACNPEVYKTAVMQGLSYEESCLQSCGQRYCHELNPKVYPTPIYETLICLMAFFAMWFNKHKFKVPGSIFFTYMIFNGIERFLIENIRVNEKYEMFGLNWSQAQYISIVFILIGVLGLIFLFRKSKTGPTP